MTEEAFKDMKKNGLIQILRIVCCLAVVALHARGLGVMGIGRVALFRAGYLAVEFFFITSGYLLARSACRAESGTAGSLAADTRRYLARRFGRIYPYYLFAFLVAFTGFMALRRCSLAQIGMRLGESVFEILMIGHASGLSLPTQEYYNFATWYLSVLLLASAIVYPVCRRFPRSFPTVAAPVLSVLAAGLLFRRFGSLDLALYPECLLRGLMELCLGCAAYGFAGWIAQGRWRKAARALFSAAEIGCCIAALAGLLLAPESRWDYPILLCWAVLVTVSFSGVSCTARIPTDGRWFPVAGKLSLLLYLCHGFCRNWVLLAFPERGPRFRFAVYLALIAVTTAACWLFVDWVLRKLPRAAAPDDQPPAAETLS